MYWENLSTKKISEAVNNALSSNIHYDNGKIMGFPSSNLNEILISDLDLADNLSFIKVLKENPNHIGLHNSKRFEKAYQGTIKLELEALKICAEEIFDAPSGSWEGYFTTGGTEGIMQAMWTFRNHFIKNHHASIDEIAVLSSKDCHYAISKSANIMNLRNIEVPVNGGTREINCRLLKILIRKAMSDRIKYLIVFLTMGTTIFGSVDEPEPIIRILKQTGIHYKIHVDAAFGGFLYPFCMPDNKLAFKNSRIDSISLDAHKILQAPYGSGIFLILKGNLECVKNEKATYLPSYDHTICGSRSGANAVAVWMILKYYGSYGLKKHAEDLILRTNKLCMEFDKLGIHYFRNKYMNIIAVKAKCIPMRLSQKYYIVPDSYVKPTWWKIIVMNHVKNKIVGCFVNDLKDSLKII